MPIRWWRKPIGAGLRQSPRWSSPSHSRKILVLAVVGVICLGLFFALTATDLVRLGPSTVSLDPDALRVSGEWFRQSDLDPSHDYYSIWIRVDNEVNDPSIRPFAMAVSVSAEDSVIFTGWIPHAGNQRASETRTRQLPGGAEIVLAPPAGAVQTRSDGGFMRWTVSGERGLVRQPLFETSADFYLDMIRIPDGAALRAQVEVRVEWFYANVLQAYSVAERVGRMACQYDPIPGAEPSTISGACG